MKGFCLYSRKLFFVNYRVFVCLFKRQGSILNNSICIWNASPSFKQTNKHSTINKNNFLEYYLSNPKEKSENRNVEKRRKCGGCLIEIVPYSSVPVSSPCYILVLFSNKNFIWEIGDIC